MMIAARPRGSVRSRMRSKSTVVFPPGQMPTDPNDDRALPAGIEAQTRRVVDNLVLVLNGAALRSSMSWRLGLPHLLTVTTTR
jgi:enamine deaminase RidA (YjgF/YER057c/UK114 family)